MTAISARRGDWMQTVSGIQFWPLDPRPEEIEIGDIAHALSNICRFGGHSRWFYSVAEHSVIVSENVSDNHRLTALLHDATEAYLGDMIRPLKRCMPIYREAERLLWLAVAAKFGLPSEIPSEVTLADNRLLLNEKAVLTGPEPAPWGVAQIGASEPLNGVLIRCLGPKAAFHKFIGAFESITGASVPLWPPYLAEVSS